MPKLKVFRGFRKGSKILRGRDGHMYHFNRKMAGGRLSFRCSYYYKKRCQGRCSIDPSGHNFLPNRNHNHLASRGAVQLRRFRHAVLHRCHTADTSTFKTIYHEERRRMKIPKTVLAYLPLKTLRPSMRRARTMRFPNNPKTISRLAKILASEDWNHLAKTLDGKDSILAATGGLHADRTQFLILMSRRMLKYLKSVNKVFSDGTFCTPSHMDCSQIWNIVTTRRNHTICLARVVMQSRKKKCYVKVLKSLKRLQKHFKPQTVMADFERPQQKAWGKVYPNAQRHACHFHFTKNICKKVKKMRFTRLVKRDKVFKSLVRSICFLPLLPEGKVHQGAAVVARRAERKGFWEKLAPLFTYMLKNWLKGDNMDIISVYRCPDRTSNVCESDNASLKMSMRSKHPSVSAFLAVVLECEDNTYQDIKTLNLGYNASVERRHSSLSNDRRLQGLWDDLDQGTISISKFLRLASHTPAGVFDKQFQ